MTKEFDLTIKKNSINNATNKDANLAFEISITGDKSITHRAIILASLANVPVTINNWLQSEDCLYTLKVMHDLGIQSITLDSNTIRIIGRGLYGLQKPRSTLYLGNSGTAIRLLSGVLAGQKFNTALTGDVSLVKRPMLRIVEPLKMMGADINATDGLAPIVINPVKELQSITYNLPVASAQVKSAVLLAGLYTKQKTTVVDKFNTRDHTERMLSFIQPYLHTSMPNTNILNNTKANDVIINVPGDISSAAFFIVVALISPNLTIIMKNIGINPTRTGAITILRQMGANIDIHDEAIINNENVATIRASSSKLHGIKVKEELVPMAIDEFPIIFVAASCAVGETIITGLNELKFKESNRLSVMIAELKKLGVNISEFADGVRIIGGEIAGGIVNSHDDHRVAMSLAIAGLVANNDVTIQNCVNINTSFPTFIGELQKLFRSRIILQSQLLEHFH